MQAAQLAACHDLPVELRVALIGMRRNRNGEYRVLLGDRQAAFPRRRGIETTGEQGRGQTVRRGVVLSGDGLVLEDVGLTDSGGNQFRQLQHSGGTRDDADYIRRTRTSEDQIQTDFAALVNGMQDGIHRDPRTGTSGGRDRQPIGARRRHMTVHAVDQPPETNPDHSLQIANQGSPRQRAALFVRLGQMCHHLAGQPVDIAYGRRKRPFQPIEFGPDETLDRHV